MSRAPIGSRNPYGLQCVEVCLTGQCDHHGTDDDERYAATAPDDERDDVPNPINARERQVALYASGVALRPQMRRRRRALDEAVTAGIAALGSPRMIELAVICDLLTQDADRWPDARLDLRELWPDRERFKLAGQLAESPIWDTA